MKDPRLITDSMLMLVLGLIISVVEVTYYYHKTLGLKRYLVITNDGTRAAHPGQISHGVINF